MSDGVKCKKIEQTLTGMVQLEESGQARLELPVGAHHRDASRTNAHTRGEEEYSRLRLLVNYRCQAACGDGKAHDI